MQAMSEAVVLKPKEVAEILRVGYATVMERLNAGEIPAYKDGADWKIPADMLHEYIRTRAVNETEERKNEKV